MSCHLCLSSEIEDFCDYPHGQDVRRYYSCQTCGLIFMDPEHWLSPLDEKVRYDQHNNNWDDPAYRDYLGRFVECFKPFLKAGMRGVDFGCGSTAGIAKILSEQGCTVESYDPYYFPSESIFQQTYDFVACCETVEHFQEPRQDFDLMFRLLKADGFLAVQTNMFDDATMDFKSWWYVRDATHVSFYRFKTFEWISAWKNVRCVKIASNAVIFHR